MCRFLQSFPEAERSGAGPAATRAQPEQRFRRPMEPHAQPLILKTHTGDRPERKETRRPGRRRPAGRASWEQSGTKDKRCRSDPRRQQTPSRSAAVQPITCFRDRSAFFRRQPSFAANPGQSTAVRESRQTVRAAFGRPTGQNPVHLFSAVRAAMPGNGRQGCFSPKERQTSRRFQETAAFSLSA